jgi:hypothetical protein
MENPETDTTEIVPIRVELQHSHLRVRHIWSRPPTKKDIDPVTKGPTSLVMCDTSLDPNKKVQRCQCGMYEYVAASAAAAKPQAVRLQDLPPEDVAALVALVRRQLQEGNPDSLPAVVNVAPRA